MMLENSQKQLNWFIDQPLSSGSEKNFSRTKQ
jgi:hypothetical protein